MIMWSHDGHPRLKTQWIHHVLTSMGGDACEVRQVSFATMPLAQLHSSMHDR